MPVETQIFSIPGPILITPMRHRDERGFLSETFNLRDLALLGINAAFVQENQSWTQQAGTVRGLHFQTPPHAQEKLVRVVRGIILDVIVDLRRSSATYGQHIAVELSAENWSQLFVPIGFAHGFCTLTPDTEVVYKLGAYYSIGSEHGILWNDPALGIKWPSNAGAFVNTRDQSLPLLAELESPFL